MFAVRAAGNSHLFVSVPITKGFARASPAGQLPLTPWGSLARRLVQSNELLCCKCISPFMGTPLHRHESALTYACSMITAACDANGATIEIDNQQVYRAFYLRRLTLIAEIPSHSWDFQ
jgi:hypothetical protein